MAAFRPYDHTVRDLVHRADALYAGKRDRIGERRHGERRRAA